MTAIRRKLLGLAVLLPATVLFAVLTVVGCACDGKGHDYGEWSFSVVGEPAREQVHQLANGDYVLVYTQIMYPPSTNYDRLIRLDSEFTAKPAGGDDSMGSSDIRTVLATAGAGFLVTRDKSLVKVNAHAHVEWRLAVESGLRDASSCRTADGGYMTVGGRTRLVKVNSGGQIEWETSCDSGLGDYSRCWVAQTVDHGYLVAGGHAVCKFDSLGAFAWRRDVADSIAWECAYLSPEGECVIAGDSSIVKLDTACNVRWQRNPNLWLHSVQPTSDGGFILAGLTKDSGCITLLKTDSLGGTEWSRTWPDADADVGSGRWAEQTTDGGYILAGSTSKYFQGIGGEDCLRKVVLKKTDANGN